MARLPIVAMMRRGLRIYPAEAKKSEERILEVFEQVAARVAGGARYLVGGRFTAADLTFAALAAPVLLPPDYGWPLPSLDELAPELRAIVLRFRAHPAGAFGLELYRAERRRVIPPDRRPK
jgi:glutathione S-transferase